MDLRVLTTLTNSHTARGVSWSPVLSACSSALTQSYDLECTIGRVSHKLSRQIRHAQEPILWGNNDKLGRQCDQEDWIALTLSPVSFSLNVSWTSFNDIRVPCSR